MTQPTFSINHGVFFAFVVFAWTAAGGGHAAIDGTAADISGAAGTADVGGDGTVCGGDGTVCGAYGLGGVLARTGLAKKLSRR